MRIRMFIAFRYKNTYEAIQKGLWNAKVYCLVAAIHVRQYKRDAGTLKCIA